MRARKFFYVVFIVVCLILFYSLHLMTNNIDKERVLSSNNAEERFMIQKLKDNVVNLKSQIDQNEKKLQKLKDFINQAQSAKENQVVKIDASDHRPIPKPNLTVQNKDVLQCPANTIKFNNNADIQMCHVIDKLPFDNPDGGVWKQGYDITYKPVNTYDQKLKVFVIPHSHCDPGWIKTFEQYFNDQTRHILDLAVLKLLQYPSMRFIYAEMSYFNLWWKNLSTEKKDSVKMLLREKRLELVTAGWVMTDEANSHYFAMVEEMIQGNQWLYNTLGYKPRSGWSIDPFGQSPTMAYLLKRMGFENMLIQRTHYAVKKHLSLEQNLEFFWRQNWDSKGDTDMFCHMMPFYSYDVPHTCGPDPKICCQFDFRRMHGSRYSCPWRVDPVAINEENVEFKAKTLLDQYRKKATLYRNNIVLVPLGDDFRYDVPEEWDNQHNNYIKLFDYMNKQKDWNVEAKFATLSEYFDEMRSRVTKPKLDYPSLSGDFFVYADRDQHYWSGYFTSRPFYKRLDRELEHHLRTAEQLFSLSLATSRSVGSKVLQESDLMASLVKARRYLGLFQHHDGITGTSKTFVVEDYGKKLLDSITALKRVITASSHYLLMTKNSDFKLNEVVFDVDETRDRHSDLAKPRVLDLLAGERKVFFYNSLGRSRKSLVTVHVNTAHVQVSDWQGNVLESQLDPVWHDKEFFNIESSKFKLHFVVTIPPLGFAGFSIKKVDAGSNAHHHIAVLNLLNNPTSNTNTGSFKITQENPSIKNEKVKVLISENSGLSESIETEGKTTKMQIMFAYYGTTHEKERSGAYLFLADGPAKPVKEGNPPLRISQGPLLNEATTKFQWVQHSLRCYSTKTGASGLALEVANLVDVRETSNTELVMRIITDVDNNDVFYTDLNGFQILKRKHYTKIPIQANFYPMASSSYIQDGSSRFTLLTGQSLGVAALKPGWLEVMQDRRLDQDDNRGMEQAMRDNVPTPNRFRLLYELDGFSDSSNSEAMGFLSMSSHFSSLDLLYPLYTLPMHHRPKEAENDNFSGGYSALKASLPCNVHLVSVRSMVDPGDEEDGVVFRVKPSLRTALILHKTSFDCGFSKVPSDAVSCSDELLKVDSIFKGPHISKLNKTLLNLSQGDHEEESKVHYLADIPSMELAAYIFQFI